MHRFFAERTGENTASLLPDEARHALTVLRIKKDDLVAVVLEQTLFEAQVSSAYSGVDVVLKAPLPSPEPKTRVTLYQGLPKGDKMDFLTQKCTEAGIAGIVPVAMPRCVVKLTQKDGEKKAERWQRIALEAAKQSGRTHVPKVEAPITLKQLTARIGAHALCLVPWEDEKTLSIRQALADKNAADIALVIGPEGGMGEEEVAALKAAGAVCVTLGKRIFRTETAGLAGLMITLTLNGEYE